MKVEQTYLGFLDKLSIGYVNDVLFKEHRFSVVVSDGKTVELFKEESE